MYKYYDIVETGDVKKALEARTEYEAAPLREAPSHTVHIQ